MKTIINTIKSFFKKNNEVELIIYKNGEKLPFDESTIVDVECVIL